MWYECDVIPASCPIYTHKYTHIQNIQPSIHKRIIISWYLTLKIISIFGVTSNLVFCRWQRCSQCLCGKEENSIPMCFSFWWKGFHALPILPWVCVVCVCVLCSYAYTLYLCISYSRCTYTIYLAMKFLTLQHLHNFSLRYCYRCLWDFLWLSCSRSLSHSFPF